MCRSRFSEEYGEVLGRAYLGLNERVFGSMKRLKESAVLVEPRRQVRISTDAKDNKFLECALEARAD